MPFFHPFLHVGSYGLEPVRPTFVGVFAAGRMFIERVLSVRFLGAVLGNNAALYIVFKHFVEHRLLRILDLGQAIQFVVNILDIARSAIVTIVIGHLVHHAADVAVVQRFATRKTAILVIKSFGEQIRPPISLISTFFTAPLMWYI